MKKEGINVQKQSVAQTRRKWLACGDIKVGGKDWRRPRHAGRAAGGANRKLSKNGFEDSDYALQKGKGAKGKKGKEELGKRHARA